MSKHTLILIVILVLPGCAGGFYVKESYHGTATEEGRLYLDDVRFSDIVPALFGAPDAHRYSRDASARVYGPCIRDGRRKSVCSRLRVDEDIEYRWR